MQDRVLVWCPHCSKRYRVRPVVIGKKGRCARCQGIFRLQTIDSQTEGDILRWIQSQSQQPAAEAPAAQEGDGFSSLSESQVTSLDESFYGAGPIQTKLQNIDRTGAHLIFPATLLHSSQFRASFPKKCAKCLRKKHLHVFLVRWDLRHRGPVGYGAKAEVHGVAALSELPVVQASELLQYLPTDTAVPEPFGFPFPYYVCNTCRPEGLVYSSGLIQEAVNRCLLTVASIDLAMEFYGANGGHETADYYKLFNHSRLKNTSGWEALPSDSRKRIMQWYKPYEQEQFICYIPDLETSSSQSGQSGIVLTSQRLICGKDVSRKQFSLQEHITVCSQSISGMVKADISTISMGKISLRLKDRAWVSLKHSLNDLKVNVRFIEI